jgi:hypothetical protein
VVAAVLAGFPLCPVGSLAGVPCPGCGLGRAAIALVRGEWAEALSLHPAAPIALPALFALATAQATAAIAQKHARALSRAAAALLVLLVAIWLARFLGAFGGPVHVDTYREFMERHR